MSNRRKLLKFGAPASLMPRRELVRRAGLGAIAAVSVALLLAASAVGGRTVPTANQLPASATTRGAVGYEIPQVSVKFGILPFPDQTLGAIAARKGWYKNVGITLDSAPFGTPVLPEQTVPLLVNGQLDVTTCWGPLFIQNMGKAPDLRMVSFTDTFYATYVLASPKIGAKTTASFIKQKLPFKQAMKKTLDQLRGKRYAVDNTGNNIAFYNNVLKGLGGLDIAKDTKLTVVDDPKIVQLALGGQIDYATPSGVGQVIRLLDEGWRPIFGIPDLLKYGPPGAASLVVGNSGLCTTANYLQKNHDTILRLVSVVFRVMDFVKAQPNEALSLQLPYLESRTGGKVGLAGLRRIILQLDPLTPFDQQTKHWVNKRSTFYFKNLYVGQIAALQKAGILPSDKTFTPDGVIVGDKIYKDLVKLKRDYEKLQPKAAKLKGSAAALAARAKQQYKARNYLDAARMLRAALGK